MRRLTVVVVSDGAVGKTTLLHRYINKTMQYEYIPTIFDDYSSLETVDETTYFLRLRDTAGQEDYDKLRISSYMGCDGIVLMFSVISPHSFSNIRSRWLPELDYFLPGVPKVLVGSKIDLRYDHEVLERLQCLNLSPITYQQGRDLAVEYNLPYIECSSLSGEGVNRVFITMIREISKAKKSKHRKCSLI